MHEESYFHVHFRSICISPKFQFFILSFGFLNYSSNQIFSLSTCKEVFNIGVFLKVLHHYFKGLFIDFTFRFTWKIPIEYSYYENLTMSFGLVNTPAFNELNSRFLGPFRYTTQDVENALAQLENVLKLLKNAGMTIRFDKCGYLTSKIN